MKTFTFELTKTIFVEIDAEFDYEACAELTTQIDNGDHEYSWNKAHVRTVLTRDAETPA